MKALTLWQPWATLIALGVKSIETRSWSTDYRGPLAIHAAARRPEFAWPEHDTLAVVGDYVVEGAGRRFFIVPQVEEPTPAYPLPLGAIVATCRLVDVVPTESLYWTGLWPRWAWQLNGGPLYPPQHALDVKSLPVVVPASQRPYGDFTPGRFGWMLADVVKLDEPIPAKGAQKLWEWKP